MKIKYRQLMQLEQQYLSVTALCRLYNTILEQSCGTVFFTGEISSLNVGARQHHYIKIKDQNSVISAIIWGSYAGSLKFKLEVGQKVLCQGTPQVYPARGDLSTIISNIKLAGQGDLQLKFLELQDKLTREGLFAKERKRQLPFLPKSIGVITSATGAVIHDMLVKFQERYPALKIYLYDARVQGEGAYKDLIAGLKYFNQDSAVDLIILARGGGSLEDLWNFNEEELVRAIFASRLPVISGVGHEPDVTLCDLVADMRAPTPTAAAEIAVPKILDLQRQLDSYAQSLNKFEFWLGNFWQKIDQLSLKFSESKVRFLQKHQQSLSHLARLLQIIEPRSLIKAKQRQINDQMLRLLQASSYSYQSFFVRVESYSDLTYYFTRAIKIKNDYLLEKYRHLQAINPTSILARGFSIVKKGQKFVRKADEVTKGEDLQIQLGTGQINVTVN